jgi:hypothetical protein
MVRQREQRENTARAQRPLAKPLSSAIFNQAPDL